MSQPETMCPLDWAAGENGKLAPNEEFRGVLIESTPHIFSYGEPYAENPSLPGQFKTIVITNVDHGRKIDYLQFAFPREYEAHFRKAMKLMEGRSYNLSFNNDFNSGARLLDHAHIKFEDRLRDEPASSWGLRGLVSHYNRAVQDLSHYRNRCGDVPFS